MSFPWEALPLPSFNPNNVPSQSSESDSMVNTTALVLLGLCGDGELGMPHGNYEQDLGSGTFQFEDDGRINTELWTNSTNQATGLDSEDNGGGFGYGVANSFFHLLNRDSPIHDSNFFSRPALPAKPICRQFWRAGEYETGKAQGLKASNRDGRNYLHVRPMFLHSNATSHKWVFGAIAELVDNAVDEIQNGATFVAIDKISSPWDGSPALLIQDDGSGMDPGAIRNCMSFGFSDKNAKQNIGQYGNGFKTSSMRLGTDVIVFSRHINMRTFTQSVGLLSFTFLKQMNYERIVVPTVDYEFNTFTGSIERLFEHGSDHFYSNLSLLLQWSPYRTEEELLKQFDDIGYHGTQVVIYNLWLSEDGNLELDFNSDPEDVRINGDLKLFMASEVRRKPEFDQHIVYRYQFSLQAYLSILYLRLHQSFTIVLRGRVVEHHNIANDLKYHEFIRYKPHTPNEAVVTTIGFLKEAPTLGINGFSIYHRNRLILPFWKVCKHRIGSVGRGVVGVLEVNYIEPIHNKQDFERTSLFLSLEIRLKQMTLEYWRLHCELLGYLPQKKSRSGCCPGKPSSSKRRYPVSDSFRAALGSLNVVPRRKRSNADVYETKTQREQNMMRKDQIPPGFVERPSKCAGTAAMSLETDNRFNEGVQHQTNTGNQARSHERTMVVQEHRRLKLLIREKRERTQTKAGKATSNRTASCRARVNEAIGRIRFVEQERRNIASHHKIGKILAMK